LRALLVAAQGEQQALREERDEVRRWGGQLRQGWAARGSAARALKPWLKPRSRRPEGAGAGARRCGRVLARLWRPSGAC
jgi:hypothetical protein